MLSILVFAIYLQHADVEISRASKQVHGGFYERSNLLVL